MSKYVKLMIIFFIAVFLFLMYMFLLNKEDKSAGFSYWQSKSIQDYNQADLEEVTFFRQKNIDLSQLESKSVIRAEVEGEWQYFDVVDAPEAFTSWNFETRLEQLREILELFKSGFPRNPTLSGPHNGMVATHGNKREDSAFSINNAVKGMGWLPKKEKMHEIRDMLIANWDSSIEEKIQVLISLYENGEKYFDLTKQSSLELYSNPGFETQSFLNQMNDPGVSIVFLDMPESYKLRCIVQMIHPDDPDLTQYERDVVDYINLIHDFFHGDMGRKSIGVIYHILQVYDNSPRPTGRGKRIMPLMM